MSCSWALIGMASRVGRSVIRPAALSASTESHDTGWPRAAASWASLTDTCSRLAGRHAHFLARDDPVGGDVDPVAVDLDVAVAR